jgi:hypothetical protein
MLAVVASTTGGSVAVTIGAGVDTGVAGAISLGVTTPGGVSVTVVVSVGDGALDVEVAVAGG